jgi:predicted lipoprotein with Yx(FWY)xxD motif
MRPCIPAAYRPRVGQYAVALTTAAILVLAACGDDSSTKTAASSAPTTPSSAATSTTLSPSTTAPSATAPGVMFSTANVAGLGTVIVDGRGRTVYILTADGHTNVACDDASGCTKAWPDLALPEGATTATVGAGLQASLLGSMKLSSGETYPTYGGWLMYEFAGDSDSGQGHGQGIKSFGGTWYALTPAGTPVPVAAASTNGGTTKPAASTNTGIKSPAAATNPGTKKSVPSTNGGTKPSAPTTRGGTSTTSYY